MNDPRGTISPYRKNIANLEAIMQEMPQVEIETKHYYAHGTYTREVFLPKGTVLTGKIHKHSCINIISKGKIAVVTDEGEKIIEAPYTFVSGSNVKKCGAVLEDTVWINVHPWIGEEDIKMIEAELMVKEEGELLCHG